jgi:hypothetical protein
MTIQGSCHCGATAFEIDGEIPRQLTRCTCSFCAKRGAVTAGYAPEQFRLVSPPSGESTYRWNTKTVAHHFCPTCGCATYTDSPDFQPDGSWDGVTRRIVVNARLFDDFDAATAELFVIDGKHLW